MSGKPAVPCSHCGCDVDLDTCHCGAAVDAHAAADGHAPVPIGCYCRPVDEQVAYDEAEEERARIRMHAGQLDGAS